MIIVCQQCGQNLPKTAVMCPNCGSRQFSPDTTFTNPDAKSTQHTAQQPTAWYDHSASATIANAANTSWQSDTPNLYANNEQMNHQFQHQPPSSYQSPQQQPHYQQPVSQEIVQPVVSNSGYVAPIDNYQTPYPPEQPYRSSNQLPSTALQTRKPAYTMLYAGFMRRAFAYVFDIALVGLILGLAYQLLLPQVLPQLGIRGFNTQTLALIAYGFYLFYMTLFTCLGRQATVGKVIMGEWVFGMQGQRIGFFHALIRECLKLILLPFSFLMWFTARKQTLHDLIARTVVLYDPN